MMSNFENKAYLKTFDELDVHLLRPILSYQNIGDSSKTIPLWRQNNFTVTGDVYYEFEVVGRVQSDEARKEEALEHGSPKSNGTGQQRRNLEEQMDLKTFIRIINAVSDQPLSNTFTAIGNDTIQITTISGDVLRVSIDNFNGLCCTPLGVNLCKICLVAIGDVEAHKLTITHMRKAITPIENWHCIRKIDGTWKHCIICNEILEYENYHTLYDQNHAMLLEQALIISSNDDVKASTNDDDMSSINDNVRALTNGNVIVTTRENGKVSRSDTDMTEATTAINKNTNSFNPEQGIDFCGEHSIRIPWENFRTYKNIVSLQQKSDDSSIANVQVSHICHEKVPNCIKNIKEHEPGRNHKKNFGTNISVIPSWTSSPGCSNIDISANKNIAKKSLNLQASATGTNDSSISNNSLPCTLTTSNEVLQAANEPATVSKKNVTHTSKSGGNNTRLTTQQPTALTNKALTLQIILKNKKKFYCTACELKLYRKNLTSHLNGFNHFRNLNKLGLDSKSIEKDKQSIPCTVCNVLVPNHPENIESHQRGVKHQKKLFEKYFKGKYYYNLI